MILAGITDIHGVVGRGDFGGAELLLIAGDVTHFGGRADAEEVLSGLMVQGRTTFAVPGNCDGDGVLQYLEGEGISVHRRVRNIDGISVYGLGGALAGPGHTPRELTEMDFEAELRRLEESGSLHGGILLCHQPPHGTRVDRALGVRHVGSRAVRAFIERVRPALCLSGHIHEASGIDRIGDTVIVNPGPFRNGKFALCRIEEGRVSCTLENI